MTALLPLGLVRLGDELPERVHAEAGLLARCATSGLAVPAGGVLLEGYDDVGPLQPQGWVAVRVLGQPAAVRVPTDRPAVVAAALRTARLATPAGARQDVLLLRAVPSVHAGRAWTGAEHDVARAVEAEAHELAAGSEARELVLRRLDRRWQRAHRGADEWRTPLPPWGMRLSRLLRDLRRTLGSARYEVTWADDGRVCRLLGVVPADERAGSTA
ncbi:MAG: hypothetical protein JWN08_1695 [Frankiales bacterium]|nr:hypothetical protein [Frankiales bacterium]